MILELIKHASESYLHNIILSSTIHRSFIFRFLQEYKSMRQLSRYASLATICWLKGTSAAAADNATKIAHTQQVKVQLVLPDCHIWLFTI